MPLPLRICFLWHQHQPDYRLGETFVLPWVRMHAAKDYRDLPRLLQRYPVKHTINLVPSMLAQIEAYNDGMLDVVEVLCNHVMKGLTQVDRDDVCEWIATLQPTMIVGLPRLQEITRMASEQGSNSLQWQDALDAMVLWHIAWCGPITQELDERIRLLMNKQRDYTPNDLAIILDCVRDAMRDVIPTMTSLNAEQFETSITPFHHPILPLVIDTDVARECMPESPLPEPAYRAPEHAARHIRRAIEYWKELSGKTTRGMWPAEGSLSMQALEMLAGHGIRWTATDEENLRRSRGQAYARTDAFFPYNVSTKHGDISVLFRDHALSDAIGFTYSSWKPEDAADDFVRRLEERRTWIIEDLGEDALEYAVIPVILDGENCWEFYEGNGAPFLDALMRRLSDTTRFRSMTCGEVSSTMTHRHLDRLAAGSWIDGNFSIWIGSPATNLAWSLLRDAKLALEGAGLGAQEIAQIMEVVEASDWFWWYDERHNAPHKGSFDVAFREHIRSIFERAGTQPPVDLTRPLSEVATMDTIKRIPVVFSTAAMHRANAIVRDLALETHEDWQRLRVRLERKPFDKEEVVLQVRGNDGFERSCLIAENELLWRSPLRDESLVWLDDNELAMYLHAREKWNVRVIEDKPDGGKLASNLDLTSR
jgi:alpha-amylase/alpha-mannosidase (GH57 family)